jgi:four helix bundle protein
VSVGRSVGRRLRTSSTPADFARFVEIAIGSLSELSYQLMAGRDVSVIPAGDYERLAEMHEVASKLLWSLYKGVRRRQGSLGRSDRLTD